MIINIFLLRHEPLVTTLFNAGPGIPDLDPEILKNSDIVCLNETEVSILPCTAMKHMVIWENVFK